MASGVLVVSFCEGMCASFGSFLRSSFFLERVCFRATMSGSHVAECRKCFSILPGVSRQVTWSCELEAKTAVLFCVVR